VPTLVYDVRANHDTGVSRYGLSLLKETAPLLAGAGWRLVVVAHPAQEERARAAVESLASEVTTCLEEGFVRRSPWLRWLLIQERIDLYYSSHYTVDPDCPVPFIFTIHDLTRLRHPELGYTDATFAERFGAAELDRIREELSYLSAWNTRGDDDALFTRYFWALNRCLVERAVRIVTVSKSSAGEVEMLLGVRPDRITLVRGAVDTGVFFRRSVEAVQALRRAHGIRGPYVLFVGLAHPNKRLPWLVEQLVRARHRFPEPARLLVVGGHGEHVPAVRRLLTGQDASDFVVFTGRVSDDDLAALYSGAAALVTASLSEGGGLPSLEAIACGCQVIATDIAPLRELLGGGAWFYDPARGDRLADLVGSALDGSLPRWTGGTPLTWADSAHRLFEAVQLTASYFGPA
jgi:glycosyltransferase involved in cell wall biosynthesis